MKFCAAGRVSSHAQIRGTMWFSAVLQCWTVSKTTWARLNHWQSQHITVFPAARAAYFLFRTVWFIKNPSNKTSVQRRVVPLKPVRGAVLFLQLVLWLTFLILVQDHRKHPGRPTFIISVWRKEITWNTPHSDSQFWPVCVSVLCFSTFISLLSFHMLFKGVMCNSRLHNTTGGSFSSPPPPPPQRWDDTRLFSCVINLAVSSKNVQWTLQTLVTGMPSSYNMTAGSFVFIWASSCELLNPTY